MYLIYFIQSKVFLTKCCDCFEVLAKTFYNTDHKSDGAKDKDSQSSKVTQAVSHICPLTSKSIVQKPIPILFKEVEIKIIVAMLKSD